MARFLTSEWFDELNGAADAGRERTREATPGVALRIQQVVTGTPDGDIRYVVRVCDGRVEVRPGDDPEADVTVTQDHATAMAVARGELRTPAALIAGRIHVAGNLQPVIEHQDALRRLDAVFAEVRDRTEVA